MARETVAVEVTVKVGEQVKECLLARLDEVPHHLMTIGMRGRRNTRN